MMKSFKSLFVTIAVVSASFQMPSMGAATVTASKNYVDRQTKVETVTNAEVGVVGYTVGTNTNCVFASTNYVDSKLGNIKTDLITDGTNTIDAARNVYATSHNWQFTGQRDDDQIWMTYEDNAWTLTVLSDSLGTDRSSIVTNENVTKLVFNFQGSDREYSITAIRDVMTYVGRLALTNDIPPAVTVVAPSTNSTAGTAADAKATGTALYTGFTEWEFSGNTMTGRVYTLEIISGEEPIYVLYEDGVMVSGVTTNSMDELTIVYDTVGITATRHLVTPTKTSQLVNDGDGMSPFATTNEIWDAVDLSSFYIDHRMLSEISSSVKFDVDGMNESEKTIQVLPFCDIDGSEADNSGLSGRVVIPPYFETNGVKYLVTGVKGGSLQDPSESIKEVIGPTSITNIGIFSFNNCTSIIRASFPYVTDIGYSAFIGCASLESVNMESVTNISGTAFMDCGNLKNIDFPHLKNAYGNSFSSCTSLESIELPELVFAGAGAFSFCTSVKYIRLASAKSLDNYVFDSNESVEYIYLPSVTNIGSMAFISCHSLSCVDFGDKQRETVPKIGPAPFQGANTNCVIVVPDQQYDEWTNEWSSIVQPVHRFIRHSDWEPARKYELSPLDGIVFDLSTNRGLYEGILNCLDQLGATITNAPSGFSKTNGVWRYVAPAQQGGN